MSQFCKFTLKQLILCEFMANKKVVVIGAGISGLTTTYLLFKDEMGVVFASKIRSLVVRLG